MIKIENVQIVNLSPVEYVGKNGYKRQMVTISFNNDLCTLIVKVLNKNIDNFNLHKYQIGDVTLASEVKNYNGRYYNDIQLVKFNCVTTLKQK